MCLSPQEAANKNLQLSAIMGHVSLKVELEHEGLIRSRHQDCIQKRHG